MLKHPSLQNKTTDVVIHQHSCRLLKMDISMSETCWAHNKWNKIASDIKLVFHSSSIYLIQCPVNKNSFEGTFLNVEWLTEQWNSYELSEDQYHTNSWTQLLKLQLRVWYCYCAINLHAVRIYCTNNRIKYFILKIN